MSKKEIFSGQVAKPVAPYSQAIESGGFVFISGQLPLNLAGEMSEDVKQQAIQCIHNIEVILKESKCSLENIVQLSVFLTNIDDLPMVNELIGSYFTKPYPARFSVQVSKLPRNASVEIAATAKLFV